MKQTYNTDLYFQYQFKILDQEIRKNIPKSTLYSWKTKNLSKIVGNDTVFSDEKIELIKNFLSNQTLLKAAKGLYFVYSTWISVTENVRGMKSSLRKNKERIVRTIDSIIPLMGL